MTQVPAEDARELARAVLSRVQANSIRLARLDLRSTAPVSGAAMRTDTTLSLAARAFDDAVVCVSRYHIEAKLDEELAERALSPNEDTWSVLVEMHGQWNLSSEGRPTDQQAQAFALAVGAMTLHPYVRSHVQAAVSAASYPPYTLDLMNSLVVGDDDGLLDLDIVSLIEDE